MPQDYKKRLAHAYVRLLQSVDWSDPLLVAGMREGLNKFLSNAHLALFSGANKYHKTELVSESALAKLEAGDSRGLIWEHVVPKDAYVQKPCEELAAQGRITPDLVCERIDRYWIVATITREENERLGVHKMPVGWDGGDVLARYRVAGIPLVPNPFFDLSKIRDDWP